MMRWELLVIVLLMRPFAAAQKTSATALADAPSATAHAASQTPAITAASAEQPAGTHRFWDRENVLLFSGVAVFRALDFASTKNFLARGRTEVLVPDDIVNNNAGFASLEAAATMTSVGISYVFHRTRHHKLERWVSIVHLSVTAFGDAHNYALKSKH
jgi:hypothetical protein